MKLPSVLIFGAICWLSGFGVALSVGESPLAPLYAPVLAVQWLGVGGMLIYHRLSARPGSVKGNPYDPK